MSITHSDTPLARQRRDWEARAALFQPDDVTFQQLMLGSVAAEEAISRTCGTLPDRVILYLHGGGYVAGSCRTHRRVTAALAQYDSARVIALDYRLAPEHPYPAALEDAVAAVLALLETVAHPRAIVLAGDSAGGGLALATLLRLRDHGAPRLGCAWLVSPWTDLTRPAGGGRPCPPDPVLCAASLAAAASAYAGERDASDPSISPAYGDFRSLPPMLVQVGAREMLIDDALAVVRAAALANVSATLQLLSDKTHSYVLLAGIEDGVASPIEDAMQWINRHSGRADGSETAQ